MVKIRIANAKAALREFSNEALNDQDCFRRTLDRIESDLGTMVGRANAWAEGDVEALRSLPFQSQFAACSAVFTGNAVARKQGMDDIQVRLENAWMAAAEKSLGENASTFAVLPVGQLIQAGGFLDKLAAKGYVIEEP
jgi:TraB/PrgY/gumN family